MKERYEKAATFPEYLERVVKNRDLWHDLYARAEVLPADVKALDELAEPRYLLALSEDWCGDAVNALPLAARLADASPLLELRVLGRDDNPDLMDAHLTSGRSRSIPVIIAYDENFRELGWWGPRPRILQLWVIEEGLALPKEDRYREIRRWYARDGGRTTINELLELVGATPAVGAK
ncbi:MAG: thioredoxin family protein [Gemmatimonadota bacterium]